MKFKFLLVLIATCFVFSVEAQTVPKSALLYKVTGKTLKKPSYIYGTIHVFCEKDLLSSAGKVGGYIAETEQMMLELDLDDPKELQKAVDSSTLKDGKTLKDYLAAEDFARLDNLYKSYLGMSVEVVQNLNPTMVSAYLFMSPKIVGCAKPAMLDRTLAEVAKQAKIPTIGLELAVEQVAALNSIPLSDQIKSLNKVSSTPDKYIKQFQNMYKVYLSQDADALYEIIVKELSAEGNSQEALLDKRNQNWIPLIEKNITSKPTFIAFGAGHLGGKNGVVALLRAKGYTLTPIRL